MSEEIKPCPRCGSMNIILHSGFFAGQLLFFVECADDTCSHHGGGMLSEKEAIADWNALPRALAWTTEPPKTPGNYWWICEQKQPDQPQIVNVVITEDNSISFFHCSQGRFLHECEKCQWAGPIDMPIPCPRRR